MSTSDVFVQLTEWVLQNDTFSGQTKSGKDDSYGCMFSIYCTYLLLGKWQKRNIFPNKKLCGAEDTPMICCMFAQI